VLLVCAVWGNCTSTEFWQARLAGYLLLAKVALDLSSASACQAYTERLFNVCGDLTAGNRNRLTKRLERRVFLKKNQREIIDVKYVDV